MSTEYKVPRILWESLESVLLASSRQYVSEIARRLEIPEKELIKRVLPSSDSLKVYIQDSKTEINQCRAYIQHYKLTVYCRKSVAQGCEFCPIHKNKRMMIMSDTTIPLNVQKITDRNDMPPMWITNDNKVVNSRYEQIGVINKEKSKLKMFVLPDSTV